LVSVSRSDQEHKITYSAAIVFSLLIWGTAEGFGAPYTSGAFDIGTAVIYALVFAALLTISYYAGPARYSADYYLEQKISWWWRVAEVRRPAPAEAHRECGQRRCCSEAQRSRPVTTRRPMRS
jgi:hypothetical protein